MRRDNDQTYFANRDCPFYPCHPGADEDSFNCLFCYCPLYCLGKDCGGDFSYLDNGVKDCSRCLLPHGKGGYDYVTKRYFHILTRMTDWERKEAGYGTE